MSDLGKILIVLVPLLFLSTRVLGIHSETVVGCGGFIRWKEAQSNSKLDFEKLKISLFSETTSTLKDVTDVLPNGAYSVPLYDEGVYRIKLTTPKGWHIEPSDGYLLDLHKDPKACSKDFDFSVVGFSIFGQVTTSGMQTGPPGLTVRISELTSHKPIAQNSTQSQGYFMISPVSPGSYSLTISNQDQTEKDHTRASIVVNVLSDSVTLSEPIVLLGHFLRGRVVDFDKKPIVSARVFLLCDKEKTTLNTSINPDKLTSSLMVDMLGEAHHNFFLSQESSTDADGYFTFDRLPGGNYALIAMYSPKNLSTTFSFTPKFYPVTMEHTDVDLGPQTFTLQTFKLKSGRILWSNGAPIPSVQVTIIGQLQKSVLSDANGYYQLEDLVPGEYSFHVGFKDVLFETRSINLNPSLESLPELRPDKVAVCGSLITAETVLNFKPEVYVDVRSIENNSLVSRVEVNWERGRFRFCTFLKPGLYSLHPDVSLSGTNRQSYDVLQYTPSEIKVDLTGFPVDNLTFSQFRAKLYGRLKCLKKCASYQTSFWAHFTSLHSGKEVKYSEFIPSKTNAHEAFFEVEGILPGDYVIQVLHSPGGGFDEISSWCWNNHEKTVGSLSQTLESSKRILQIRSNDLHYDKEVVLDFIQTGFLIPVKFELPNYVKSMPPVLLHASTFIKKNNQTVESTMMWKLNKTCNKICLPSSDQVFKFNVSSTCTQFRMLQGTEVNPSHNRYLSFRTGPRIRISVDKLPVFIHLNLDKIATRFVNDFKEIFSAPFSFESIDFGLYGTETLKSVLVNTSWPEIPHNRESLSATGMFWVQLGNMVRVIPKQPTLKQNQFAHLNVNPSSQNISLQRYSSKDSYTDSISCGLTMPEVHTTKPASINNAKSVCSSFYNGQHIKFVLTIAVNLRGRIEPPVEKVDVELYHKLSQSSAQSSIFLKRGHPLLPVDSETELLNELDYFNTPAYVATTQTDRQGIFTFSALPLVNYEEFNIKSLSEVSKMYEITISKAGYKFDVVNDTDTKHLRDFHWYIRSTRLSLVEVFVFKHPVSNDSNQPLSAVLISIIGEGHRANHLTNNDGVVRFVGLSPGQYYLRPMMKEYSFTVISPDSSESGHAIPVQVEEGKSAVVILSAHRIAFSVSGTVTSLAGIPESGVLVEAAWLPNPPKTMHNDVLHLESSVNMSCQLRSDQINIIPREQSLTDSDGNFRIRGLIPGCVYTISVQNSSSTLINSMTDQLSVDSSSSSVSRRGVERAIPCHLNLQMPSTDTSGLHFYVIRHTYTSTVTVSVQTSDNYLPTLRLVVFPVGHPEDIVEKHDFANDSLLFTLSGSKLAAMFGREHVIRLLSDLKPNFYANVEAQNIIFTPKWSVNEHFNFHFNPKLRTSLND
ncbi:unnamed protein product [Trichobilharzia szidati]|nr:unnamed protein product [Trichobilharzia szidati]